MRVLAIDPALRNTGYAVIEDLPEASRNHQSQTHRALTYGVIHNPKELRQSQCLVENRRAVIKLVSEFHPDVCAVEAVIYVQSFQTAIVMGAARASSLMAAAEADIPIHEYPPKRVKQAVVGRGSATKDQVAFMMRALFGLKETPVSDAADALAIGLAHFYTSPTKSLLDQAVRQL
ncbi:MAG: crossover junction endodeoxyribonuclease RuvC [Verrucomicrobiota bacterium]